MSEGWQVAIIREKIEQVQHRAFSIQVDLRVAKKVGDEEGVKQVTEVLRRNEALLVALEEELEAVTLTLKESND